MSDGETDLIDVANEMGICVLDLEPAVQDLVGAGLLEAAVEPS